MTRHFKAVMQFSVWNIYQAENLRKWQGKFWEESLEMVDKCLRNLEFFHTEKLFSVYSFSRVCPVYLMEDCRMVLSLYNTKKNILVQIQFIFCLSFPVSI